MKKSIGGTAIRRVLFVLGSGVSSEICPNVEALTKAVLDPKPKWDCYDRKEEFEAIGGFLKVLQEQGRPTVGECTYEDLFSMCEQLSEWELELAHDPALRLFRNQVYAESQAYWKFYQGGCYLGELPLAAIARKAQQAIHVTIRKALIKKNDPGNQLNFIAETIGSLGPKNVDVLTLNHDCLVEALLDREGIEWTDGFDPMISQDKDVVNFDARAFVGAERVRIIKLHGSCDWVYTGTDQHNFRWAKATGEQPIDRIRKATRAPSLCDAETAPTLTGTTTKSSAYTKGLHAALYLEVRKLLAEHEHIICSGYGWKDDGINTMLKEWSTHQLWHEPKRRFPRLLLLHAEDHLNEFNDSQKLWFWPDNWKQDLSQPWQREHSDWMRCHGHWLSCTHFSEIENALFE